MGSPAEWADDEHPPGGAAHVAGAQPTDAEQQRADAAAQADSELRDFDWSALPPDFSATTFAAPSGPLATISCGDEAAQPVLLVPGATGSKEDFVLMMPLLAAAGYFTLSFDLAGQYQSAAAGPEKLSPPRAHYDHELFVNDLLAVLRKLNRPTHVIGYSFAGIIAGLAFARAPERFASLTLLSCPPLSGQSFRGVSRIGPATGFANARVGAALMMWGIRRNLVPVAPGRLRFVRDRFALTRRDSVRDIVDLMRRNPDISVPLARAGLPKLVAVGEHDLWPTALHADFARSLGADVIVYPTGHSPCETSPHQLCRDLIARYATAER